MKICIVTTIPSPYRTPLFNRINSLLKIHGYELFVVFLAKGYQRRKWTFDASTWNFQYFFLNDPKITTGEVFFSFAFSLLGLLFKLNPDIVVTGGFSVPTIWSTLYCQLNRKKSLIWSGETIDENSTRSYQWIRTLFRRFMVKKSDGFISYGNKSKEYLLSIGASESDIRIAINTVDTQFYSFYSNEKNPDPTVKKIIFVGHLEKRKGIFELIEAFSIIQRKKTNLGFKFELHIIGDGTQAKNLVQFIETKKLTNIRLHGFQQSDYIRSLFRSMDILVFPSLTELYGLVPIEGMAAGLPVLVSKYAGISGELHECKYSQMLFDPKNILDFADKMYSVLTVTTLYFTLKMLSRELCEKKFSIKLSANSFTKALVAIDV